MDIIPCHHDLLGAHPDRQCGCPCGISTPPADKILEPAGFGDKKHAHYFKDVSHLTEIDVYRVLDLFGVIDPCLQHAAKKLLVAGGRGAKDMPKDIQEAIDTLERWKVMRQENQRKAL